MTQFCTGRHVLVRLIGYAMGAVFLLAAGSAPAQQDPTKSMGDMKDLGGAIEESAGDLVECTPERAAQDAALKEKTGMSTGCTPEKAAEGALKDKIPEGIPGK